MESKGETIIYQAEEWSSELEGHLENEMIWLSQKLMSAIFNKDPDIISLHIKNICKSS